MKKISAPGPIAQPVNKDLSKLKRSEKTNVLNKISFGEFNIPLSLKTILLELSLKRIGQQINYFRKCGDDEIEKIVMADASKIRLNPIEPVNKPDHLTPYLMIDFTKPIMIEPNVKKKIYIKFPIEVGVFIRHTGGFELIDIFTFTKLKYTLYHDPRSGVLCKYWKSDVFSSIPATNINYEGVIELNIINSCKKWINVTKTILNAYGMEIFYNQNFVSIKANMKVKNEMVAETEVLPIPLLKGMKQSIELYTTLPPPILIKEFVMEVGL
jgi:hypothetical protein